MLKGNPTAHVGNHGEVLVVHQAVVMPLEVQGHLLMEVGTV